MSSMEGYNTPADTPIPKKKGIKARSGESENSFSATGASAPSTPRAGRKRKKTPPGESEKSETTLAKAKQVSRGTKTHRNSDVESAGGGGKSQPTPTPPLFHDSQMEDKGKGQPSLPRKDTLAPEEKAAHTAEPIHETEPEAPPKDIEVVSLSSEDMENTAMKSANSLESLADINITGPNAEMFNRIWKGLPLRGRGRGRPTKTGGVQWPR